MKIVVLVKEVPDTYGERRLDSAGRVDRVGSDAVIDEIGERAVEAALAYRDAGGAAQIVVMAMGPASVADGLRRCLAMGADAAVHIVDDGLAGADALLTARTLAAAVRREGFDLVIAGNESTDGRGGIVPALVAELLRVPHATSLNTLQIGEGEVAGLRADEGELLSLRAVLPAVVSITERMPEARFPGLRGRMAAKKKPFDTVGLGTLGIGAQLPETVIVGVSARPPREAGIKISDSEGAVADLVEFLAARGLV